jgi:hypothetical protein
MEEMYVQIDVKEVTDTHALGKNTPPPGKNNTIRLAVTINYKRS